MMGTADPQPSMCYHIHQEQDVPADPPMRAICPWIDPARSWQRGEPWYAETGRQSIQPEPLLLALLGGYRRGTPSARAVVRELPGSLGLRWGVGLDVEQRSWAHATVSQNRTRRGTERRLLARVCEETVARAITQQRVFLHRGGHAPDSMTGGGVGSGPGAGESHGHVSRGAALDLAAWLHDGSRGHAGQHRQ